MSALGLLRLGTPLLCSLKQGSASVAVMQVSPAGVIYFDIYEFLDFPQLLFACLAAASLPMCQARHTGASSRKRLMRYMHGGMTKC